MRMRVGSKVTWTRRRKNSGGAAAVILLMAAVLAMAACGKDVTPDVDPPAATPAPISFDRSADFADPGGKPSQEWVDGIVAWLKDYDDSASSCPVGDVSTLLNALGPRRGEVELASGTAEPVFDVIDMIKKGGLDDTDKGSCQAGDGGGGVHVDFSYAPKIATAEEALREGFQFVFGSAEYSRPEPFLGGDAWTYCYVNGSTDYEVCGSEWFYKGLLVTTRLFFNPSVDSQYAADWFSTVLPTLAGVKPAAEPLAPAISHSWTDGVGYSYTWKVYNPRTSVTTNTEDQLPGKALVTTTIDADVEITNDTPNRNIGPGTIEVELRPTFKESSPVCDDDEHAPIVSYVNPVSLTDDPIRTGYCYLSGPQTLRLEEPLASGESFTTSYPSETISEVVDESKLDTIVADLEHPVFWALARYTKNEYPASANDHWCRGAFHGLIVQTSEAGSRICAQGLQ